MPQTEDSRRTALITGAAKRLGRTIALSLASNGWDIAIHYLTAESEAHSLQQTISEMGRQAVTLCADLQNPSEAKDLVTRCTQALAAPSCLVNNGAVFQCDDIESLTETQWDHHLNVNLKSPIMLSQTFAKELPPSVKGNIINIIDQRVWKLTPQFFSYTISKSALWTATQTLAQALAPDIRVNAIGPGPILRSVHQSEQQFYKQQHATPLGHETSPEEIARAILFILETPALTGQMLALDSGQHLAWQTPDVIGVE